MPRVCDDDYDRIPKFGSGAGASRRGSETAGSRTLLRCNQYQDMKGLIQCQADYLWMKVACRLSVNVGSRYQNVFEDPAKSKV